jgi:hypothetical protein
MKNLTPRSGGSGNVQKDLSAALRMRDGFIGAPTLAGDSCDRQARSGTRHTL